VNPIRRLYRPEYFQGRSGFRRRRGYFEGWYYKFSSHDGTYAWIPGVSLGKDAGAEHAFVQTNNSITGHTGYEKFPLDEFIQDTHRFRISVGGNSFSMEELSINLPDSTASLVFQDAARWPSSLLSPTSMGPYAFVPSMECYHGILILDAQASGTINGDTVEGRLYVEKDWGRSFPEGWVWIQANRFDESHSTGTDADDPTSGVPSLTCSVARVPFRGTTFPGFIIGLYLPSFEPALLRFTPYNGAKIERVDTGENSAIITVIRKEWTLQIEAESVSEHEPRLISPIDGRMEGTITESLDAHIDARLTRGGETVFSSSSTCGGLEIVNPERI
jgi:tocopherol cyclase